jgi:hypothetical protein
MELVLVFYFKFSQRSLRRQKRSDVLRKNYISYIYCKSACGQSEPKSDLLITWATTKLFLIIVMSTVLQNFCEI